jgi:hypothetical protein
MLTRTVVEINGKKFEVPLPQKAVQARIKTINDLLLIEIDRVFNDKKATRPDGPPPRFTPNLLPRIQEVRAARAMPEVSSLVILEAILDSGAVRDLLVKLGTSYEELGVVLDTHWKLPSFHPAVAEGAPKPSGS